MFRTFVLCASLMILCGGFAAADCGSIPFDAPVRVRDLIVQEDRSLDFNPLDVTVFEPRQRALILWNGEEEILLLSTDQRASQTSAVLEVIPLPAEPKVRLGSFDTFEKAQQLVVRKRMWLVASGGKPANAAIPRSAARVAFHKKMGAHDLVVIEALSRDGFVEAVQGHLNQTYGVENAAIKPAFAEMIKSYIDAGYKWFTFDMIVLSDKEQSRQPVEYRFKSDAVYYPMRISTLEQGKTDVDLLVFTPRGASQFDGLVPNRVEKPIDVTRPEVEGLAEGWAGFYGARPELRMERWNIRGDISTFLLDVRAR